MNISSFRNSFTLLRQVAQHNFVAVRTEFESAYTLKKLYPNSSLKITTPAEQEINEKSSQKFTGYIPLDQLEISACRSSGPGGQHVNKINTKAEVRFHLESATWIPEELREQLLQIKKNQLTKEGYLIIKSDKTRSYQMNLADVLQRLRTIIYKAEEANKPPAEPSPIKLHEMRRRKEKANIERLREKRFRSAVAQCRRGVE